MKQHLADKAATVEPGRARRGTGPALSETQPGATRHPILQLQGTIGNQAVNRLLQSGRLQTKLTVDRSSDTPVQRQESDEAERLQGKFPQEKVPMGQRNRPDDALQKKPGAPAAPPSHPNRTGLPDNLKSGIESLSGLSMDNVNVHYNSAQPARLNALAYTQGTEIHVAPRQERHLPHEAWHVVQQAQGRVQPTMQLKDGVPVNDDAGLEQEADVMGLKAVQMRRPDQVSTDPRARTATAQQIGLRTETSDAHSKETGTSDRKVDSSPRVKQLRASKEIMNSNLQAKQATQLQTMADNYVASEQHPIQNKENNTSLPVQRIHVHMSGSGVEAGKESVGKKFGVSYMEKASTGRNRESFTVSGPGRGPESEHLGEQLLGKGTTQTYGGQNARILKAVQRIGAAWLHNDREIILTGFSRGGANAIEVARFINLYGLLNSNNDVIEGTKGAEIKYLGLLDPVPAESLFWVSAGWGTARKLTSVNVAQSNPLAESISPETGVTKTTRPAPHQLDIASEAVWYKSLDVPGNVKFVQSILAHAETRGSFEAYRVTAEQKKTRVERDVIPFAVHSQVGGTAYGGTGSPPALLAFDALLEGAKNAGVDFGKLKSLSGEDRRNYVAMLFEYPRAAEDFMTQCMTYMQPKLRSFSQHEIGPIADEFIKQLSSQSTASSKAELLSPIVEQFNRTPLYSTASQSLPNNYLAAITGRTTPESSLSFPRTGAILTGVALMPQILLFMVVITWLFKFVRSLWR